MSAAPGGLDGRAELLRAAGASGDVLEELLRYDTPLVVPEAVEAAAAADYEDEPHLAAWEAYAREAAVHGVIPALRDRLPQLRFPVHAGISATEEYGAATRRGEPPGEGGGPAFARPEEITLSLHPTLAGRLPVLIAGERADFETLVRVFSARSEPVPVPASMGACLIRGFNNWDRVGVFRRVWEKAHPDAAWAEEGFAELLENRARFEDRFMILSSGPYSGVSASEAGFDADAWAALSIRIRRDHECTHYFTLRAAQATRANLLDEVLADYVGLVGTFGHYREDLALRFFGLEDYPAYRSGARLENYRGTPPLSDGAVLVLRVLVHDAIRNLDRLDASLSPGTRRGKGLARLVLALGSRSLAELASGSPPALGKEQAPGERVILGTTTSRRGLDDVMRAFEKLADRHAVAAAPRAQVLVVLDELLSNVKKHAFVDRRAHEVVVELRIEPSVLEIVIEDAGIAFDPLAVAPPETGLPLHRRPIGGLGVLTARRLTDEQFYERRDGKNRLVLRKRL